MEVDTDGGKLALHGKRYLLDAGVAYITDMDKWDRQFPMIEIPPLGDRQQLTVYGGTRDPLLICLARRGHTIKREGLDIENIPVPTPEEATTELVSGKDLYGGQWSAPRLAPAPLDDQEELR